MVWALIPAILRWQDDMSQVDANIPLSVKRPEFMSPAQAISLQSMVQQIQAQKLQQTEMMKGIEMSNLVKQRLAQPDAWEPSGLPSQVALGDISKINPELGVKMVGQRQHILDEQAVSKSRILADQTNELKLRESLKKSQDEILESAVSFVDSTMPNASPEAKDAAVRQKVQEGLDRQEKSGGYPYTPEQWNNLRKFNYSYDDAKARVTPLKEALAERKEALAEKKQETMPLSDVGKVEADYKAGKIDKKTRDAAMAKKEGLVVKLEGDAVSAAQSKLHGDEYLATLKPAEQGLVKSIAEGKIDPKSLSTRGGHRERILQQVVQYQPNYNQQEYGQADKAVKDFGTGRQGQSVRAFNVALEHLDTLQELGNALHNKDFPLINTLANRYKTETGEPGPTSFDGAKQLVADEVVKAIVGSGGGVQDREEAAKTIRAASSPQQLVGIIKTYKHLFGGQIKGLEQQYKSLSKRDDFRDRFLTEKGRKAAGEDAVEVRPFGEKKVTGRELEFDDPEKEKRYQQWKKANGK